MKLERLSIKILCQRIGADMAVSVLAITAALCLLVFLCDEQQRAAIALADLIVRIEDNRIMGTGSGSL